MNKMILWCGLLLWTLAGCSYTWEDLIYGEHQFSEPFDQPYDDIWDVLVEVMERNYELEKLNKKESRLVSKWEEVYAPIRGHGFRTRVDAYLKEEEGMYIVGIRAIQDKNDDIERPMEPDEAEWEYIGRNDFIEKKVLQQIRYYLQKDFGPSDQLRKQMEMEEDRRSEEKLRLYR